MSRLLLFGFLLIGWSSPIAAQTRPPVPVRTFASDSFWTTVWTRGFSKEPDLFIEPRRLAVVGTSLVVLDHGTRDLLVLDGATGKSQARINAQQGSGPGEVRRPFELIAIPGGFAVSDQGNSRLSGFDLRGRFLWDIPLSSPSDRPICIVDGGKTVLLHTSDGASIDFRDTSGTLLKQAVVPWHTQEGPAMQNAAVSAGPAAKGECVLARAFGPGFAAIGRDRTVATHSFVETVPEGQMKTTENGRERLENKTMLVQTTTTFTGSQSAMNAMVAGDTLVIRFGGATTNRMRVLDYYLLPSGRYLHSRKLPAYFVAVALRPDGLVYAADIRDEYSGVVLLRPSATRPPRSR